MSIASARVPVALACGIIGVLLGGGGATAIMMAYGYHWEREPTRFSPVSLIGAGSGAAPGDVGPNAKKPLVDLVAKLDVLTEKPLTISLSAEEKGKMSEILAGLSEVEDLSEAEAKKRLDPLLRLLRDRRDTLEAAGYQWPGRNSNSTAPGSPNPFREAANEKHLKSLSARLAKE